MNILFGLYHADEGEILIDGRPVRFDSPGDAIAAGLGMVHQHFMLIPVFTVTENVMLGVGSTRPLGLLDRGAARRRVQEIGRRYGLDVPPDAVAEDVHDDRAQVAVAEVSLEVRGGEIVCVAGVQGNGQTELVEALVGLRPVATGGIRVAGRDVTRYSAH